VDGEAANQTGATLVIDVTKLLSQATGTGLNVTGVQSPTLMSGTASLVGSPATGISYTAPSGAGTDHFTYTITDVNGCTASATIYVTNSVSSGYSPNYVAGSASYVGGTWTVEFMGIPGVTYGIERAPSTTGTWVRIGTVTASSTPGSEGLITVTDPPLTSEGGGASSYYRTVYP
jgi:hypothetical protein